MPTSANSSAAATHPRTLPKNKSSTPRSQNSSPNTSASRSEPACRLSLNLASKFSFGQNSFYPTCNSPRDKGWGVTRSAQKLARAEWVRSIWRRVLFVTYPEWKIWETPVGGGPLVPLTDRPAYRPGSRDGHWLGCSRGTETSDAILITEIK